MSTIDDMMRRATGNMTPDSDNESQEMNCNIIILEEYLALHSPVESFGGGVIIRTTADIISELSDMAELTVDEVNAVLIRRGFLPGRNKSGSFGWMMSLRAD